VVAALKPTHLRIRFPPARTLSLQLGSKGPPQRFVATASSPAFDPGPVLVLAVALISTAASASQGTRISINFCPHPRVSESSDSFAALRLSLPAFMADTERFFPSSRVSGSACLQRVTFSPSLAQTPFSVAKLVMGQLDRRQPSVEATSHGCTYVNNIAILLTLGWMRPDVFCDVSPALQLLQLLQLDRYLRVDDGRRPELHVCVEFPLWRGRELDAVSVLSMLAWPAVRGDNTYRLHDAPSTSQNTMRDT
jgi:hypothetical protein